MIKLFEKFIVAIKKPKILLLISNILLVFFLILLSNLKVLPFKGVGDFGFFVFLGLILALYRPGWGFLFFVGTIALENINLAPVNIGIAVRPYQFFSGITICSILIRLLTGRLNFKLAKFRWPDYLIGIIVVAGFLSALFADGRALSLKLSVVLLTFGLLYLLTRNYIQDSNDLEKVVPFFLSSGIVVIAYGIWQNVRFAQGMAHFEVMPGRPNATFAEADWLGIYLILLIAVIYSLIYVANKTRRSFTDEISNYQIPISKQITNPKSQIYKLYFLYFFLILILILLILTVSRSAWLGALAVSSLYFLFCSWYFGFKNKDWKGFLKQLILLVVTGIASIAIVYFFNLTNFQLFNRAQSTGTGLQKITIACNKNSEIHKKLKESAYRVIDDISELAPYDCRHINLEEINIEKARENLVYEIYRKDPNVDIRKVIYQKSWAEIKKHPVLGIGWGNISEILGKDERGARFNSSNIFLEVWLGSGIFGFAAFLAIWASVIIMSFKKILGDEKAIGAFMLLGAVAIIVPNLFNAGLFLGIVWIYLGAAVSLKYANRD